VTLRKMHRDKIPMPFKTAQEVTPRGTRRVADPAQGFLSALGIKSQFAE
jgi:hypothetical protein